MTQNYKIHSVLLILWFGLGLILRLINLEAKPIWSDEFATLVFSLGHSFRTIPLDQPISLETLLAPLTLDSGIDLGAVFQNLLIESNHPPVYFILTHLWVKLFDNPGEFVSIWGARSLSAILGAISIPALFGLSWLAFRSVLVGQFSAALIAIAPFGVYLAQEARHYTLAIILIIASLSCCIVAIQRLKQKINLPVWIILTWIGINTLGIAVHFFFIVVLGAIALVIVKLWLEELQINQKQSDLKSQEFFHRLPQSQAWTRIYLAALGSMVGSLVWLPILFSISSSESGLISWVFHGESSREFIAPLVRTFAWMITMVVIFPVESQSLGVTIASVIGMLGVTGLSIKLILQSRTVFPKTWQENNQVLIDITVSILLILLITTYGFGIDLTLAARYQFTYFPLLLSLFAVHLSLMWQTIEKAQQTKKWIGIILISGLISSVMVTYNLAYQKPDRSDLVAKAIAPTLSLEIPTLIATVHKNHEQTGEMMGIAWELNRLNSSGKQPQFLLAQKLGDSAISVNTLNQILDQSPRPLNLWTVNFSAPQNLESQNCLEDSASKSRVPGYYFRMYQCLSR
ncbi:MAG: glycosyltransferase family 39 protein [Microcoleaceae cyanobacterium]